MAVKGSVPAPGVLVPHLVVRDASEAVSFYTQAFAAQVLYRSPSPSGVGEHIHLKIWDSLVQVSTEEPAQRSEKMEGALLASPETLSGSTCVFQVGVADVDSAFKRAVDHGATPALPPTDMFWGDRYGWIRDPFGHVWALSTVKEVLTQEEVERRLNGFAAPSKGQDK
ncbi:MAG: VOC family protein [Candidatus Acidiferrales bacterium]